MVKLDKKVWSALRRKGITERLEPMPPRDESGFCVVAQLRVLLPPKDGSPDDYKFQISGMQGAEIGDVLQVLQDALTFFKEQASAEA